ncbi:protein CANDIDATE G-PROTEIN COUPLED RECEPTOR 7-like [Lactuca sativa]|uniref:protein CANDIDATE G-PROTEIN COUPLED RECEPTOR 7-like n=1 Tax=Lactuca sativa TaxID=4236 RepID=UPI001C68832F|nr:protein CANDIDATE G-PROTEIN COUPLED RECEPTOR 7-like [Lactuca sativa]
MRVLGIIILAVLLLFTPPSTAEIQSRNIRWNDQYLILFEEFEFTNTGFVSVAISNVSVISPYDFDPSSMGFFLVQSDLKELALQLFNRKFCVMNSRLISPLFTFQNLSCPYSSFNMTYPTPYPNMLSLYYANCNDKTYVTMDVRTELYNTVNDTTKIYLSLTQLPSFYFKFSLVYLFFLGFWIFLCFKNKKSICMVDLLMGGLLVVSVLLLISKSMEKHYVEVTGTPHGWDTMVYTLQFFRIVFLFAVITLNSTRWSCLEGHEVFVMLFCLGIFLLLTLLSYLPSLIIRDDTSSEEWIPFCLEMMMRIFGILFPIFMSIRSLDHASYMTDDKVFKSLVVFWTCFLIVATGYLFYWRIPIFVVKVSLGYKYYRWVSIVGEEICNLLFYMVMFYMFSRLRKMIEFFVLEAKDEENKHDSYRGW